VIADALVSLNLHVAEVRQLSRLGGERDHRFASVLPVVFRRVHLRVWIAVILQLVHRHLVRADHELAISRLSDRERHPALEIGEMIGRDNVEAFEVDGRHVDGLAFGDGQRDVDGVLLLVQVHVEAGDARVGKSAIGIESLDTLEVRVEPRSIEVCLLAPRQLRALMCGERVLESALVDPLHALKFQAVNLDRPFFLTAARNQREGKQRDSAEARTHGGGTRNTTRAELGGGQGR